MLDLLGLANKSARGYAKQRQMFPLLLQMIVLVARDTLLIVEGAIREDDDEHSVPLVNTDKRPELDLLANGYGTSGLTQVIRQAEQAEREIAGYAHSELTLGSLFVGMARESDQARALAGRE